MNRVRPIVSALLAAGSLAAAEAGAVTFSITGADFEPNKYGYGIDPCEVCGTLLNVAFDSSGLTPQDFTLAAIGDFYTFDLGTVTLAEPASFGGIQKGETNHLEVSATLNFATPLGAILHLSGLGTAFKGPLADAHVDYSLAWDPLRMDFGVGGLFELALQPLSFTGNGTQIQRASLTLLQLPTTPVPEPGALALAGLGLVALGLTRRRRAG